MKPSKTSWQDRISGALDLGRFIAWNEGSDFIDDLGEVHRNLVKLSKTRPKEALEYFGIFLAGCLIKGQEVDDSGDSLEMFLEELFRSWARCCSASGMKPDEFPGKIAHWIKADDIGYCHDLEATLIPSLSAEYRSALRTALEQRLCEKPSDQAQGPEQHKLLYQYRSALSTIKKFFISTNDTTSLIEIGERHGFTPDDCLALATAFSPRRQPERALEWVERGLKCDETRYYRQDELERLRRQLLTKTGRRGDAVNDAWKKFEQCPSIYSFKDVLECASRADKAGLTEKALAIFAKADLRQAVEALYNLGKTDYLISRIDGSGDVDLKQLFYGTAIPIARSLAKKFPKQAARLYVSQALVILDASKSKAYHHAHDYLFEAKGLLEHAGDGASWLKLTEKIRKEHKRKSGFMPGFDAIVADRGPIRPPSFMERISSKLDQE